jgi:hypothetical protein
VTVLLPSIVTWQVVDVPEQTPPDQPVKVEPGSGVAARVTLVQPAKDALQVSPQLIQLGNEVTVPLPLPGLLMVSENVVAGTEVADEVVVTYVVDVVGGIDVVEVVGVAGTEVADEVVVTYVVDVVGGIDVVEVVGVAGTEVADEVVVTYVVDVVGGIDVVEVVLTILVLKLAVIVVFAFIVAVHSPVPLHSPPDQPSKVDPGSAVAERDTTVPGL